ncbi:MAG: hypothetical protein GY943_02570, partial [Chloroflexi bacterium]|nr:hypothetical protein [Chloroflexota bacterium]
LASGVAALASGAAALVSGVVALVSGVAALVSGAAALVSGVGTQIGLLIVNLTHQRLHQQPGSKIIESISIYHQTIWHDFI